jgi:MFS family permease
LSNHEINGTTSKPRIFFGWYIVAAAWIMFFLNTGTAVAIFFKPLLEEFGWDRALLSLVSGLVLIVTAIFSPLLGRFIDRFGARAMLFVCSAAQPLASVVTGLATNIGHVFLGRMLSEIRYSVAGQILVNRWFIKKRGTALGILATSSPIGTLLLSPLTQYLILTWGWRETLIFWAIVTLAIVLPLTLMIKNKPEDKGLVPDGDYSTAASTAAFPAAKAASARPDSGTTFKEALRHRAFWLFAAAQIVCGIGCGIMMTHSVIFATDLGYSPMIGATFLSVQGGANLIGVLVTGRMSDKIARHRVLALVHLVRSVSFILLVISVFSGGSSLIMLYIAMAFFGIGWFTTAPLAAGLVADLYGNLRMGTLMGLIWSCHMVGMAIGTYAGGLNYQLTHSYLSIFAVQGFLEFLAAIFVFIIRKTPRSTAPGPSALNCC